jgi:hypothetical protein
MRPEEMAASIFGKPRDQSQGNAARQLIKQLKQTITIQADELKVCRLKYRDLAST